MEKRSSHHPATVSIQSEQLNSSLLTFGTPQATLSFQSEQLYNQSVILTSETEYCMPSRCSKQEAGFGASWAIQMERFQSSYSNAPFFHLKSRHTFTIQIISQINTTLEQNNQKITMPNILIRQCTDTVTTITIGACRAHVHDWPTDETANEPFFSPGVHTSGRARGLGTITTFPHS